MPPLTTAVSIGMVAVGALGVWAGIWLLYALRQEDIMYSIVDLGGSPATLQHFFKRMFTAELLLLGASLIYLYGGLQGNKLFITIAETIYLLVAFVAVVALQYLEVELV